MKKTKKIILLVVFIISLLPIIVKADVSVNINGTPSGSSGGGGTGATKGRWALLKGSGLVINLVKVSNNNFDVITYYYIINSGQYSTYFSSSKNRGGAKSVYGSLGASSSTYNTGSFTAPNSYSEDPWYDDTSIQGYSISSSKIVNALYSGKTFKDKFYEILSKLFVQAGSSLPSELQSFTSQSELKRLITQYKDDSDLAKVAAKLSDYRVVIEPIYGFYDNKTGDYDSRIFATIKAVATARINNYAYDANYGGLSYNPDSLVLNVHACGGKPGDPFSCADASFQGMTNKLTAYGYGVISIVDKIEMCDPKTMCCFDASGTYHEEYKGRDESRFECGDKNKSYKKGDKCEATLKSCKEETPQNCKDDVKTTDCYDSGEKMEAHFYEDNNVKNCTLNDAEKSGFTMLDIKYRLDDRSSEHNYCKIACKEDYDFNFPTTKFAASGRYFKLDEYIPNIKAKRTCVSNPIDHDGFIEDMTNAEKEMVLNYNGAQDNAYIANTAQNSGITYGSITNVHPGGLFKFNSQKDNVDKRTGNSTGSCCTAWGYTKEGDRYCASRATWPIYIWNGYDAMSLLNGHKEVSSRDNFANGAAYATHKPAGGGDSWNIGTRPNCVDGGGGGKWVSSTSDADREIASVYQGIVSDYNGRINTNISGYINYRFQYSDAQKQYKKCTSNEPSQTESWLINENYSYKFKPKVTFEYQEKGQNYYPTTYTYSYDENNGDVDTKEKNVSENKKDTKLYGAYRSNADNEYNNVDNPKQTTCDNMYQLLDCVDHASSITTCSIELPTTNSGDGCTKANGSSRNTPESFASDKYIKRYENYEYEYHLPTIYTYIPNGRTELLKKFKEPEKQAPSTNTIILENEAAPVNINTFEGVYDYSIKIENIVNEQDRDRRYTSRNAGYPKVDNIDQRGIRFYDTKEGKGALNDADNSQYLCKYKVINEIYDPQKQRVKFFYKPIDLTNIHPSRDIPNIGYNWNDAYSPMSISKIEETLNATGNDYQYLTNDNTGTIDRFEFVLTPNIMKAIRKFNKSSPEGYADWNLKCNENYGEKDYYCESDFLTCFASGGTNNCTINKMGTLFEGGVLNNYYDFSKYTSSDLIKNREILKNKVKTYAKVGG